MRYEGVVVLSHFLGVNFEVLSLYTLPHPLIYMTRYTKTIFICGTVYIILPFNPSVLYMLGYSTLNQMLMCFSFYFLQVLVYDCLRAARAERGSRRSSANLEHGA